MTQQEERIQKMRERGIPIPITQIPMNEGAVGTVPITSQNADKHARLQALKSGANKQQVQALVKAKTIQNSFEGIPEPSRTRRPQGHPGNQVDPSKVVPVQNFAASQGSGEFASMEAMMSGTGGAVAPVNMHMQPPAAMNTTQPELQIQENGYGPSFDPVGMLAKKRADMQRGNAYMQHSLAQGTQLQVEDVSQQQQISQQQPLGQQQQFDIKYIQQMMQEIAKNTISEVLNSYTEKNKDKLTYENITKTKDGSQVIKTQDGQYFKLTPVRLKN